VVSVRRVTQDNAGKDTPGIDKVVLKTPVARAELAQDIIDNGINGHKPLPVKRVFIPKANGKQRPLGIPVIKDRAIQAMVRNALEPEWEARFEPGSYGFRPGRGCHDATSRIYLAAKGSTGYTVALDADIKGAFDNINHGFLLNALSGFPARHMIGRWLKAGVMADGKFEQTEVGTPQGGVISPLLLNVALHGLETAAVTSRGGRRETEYDFSKPMKIYGPNKGQPFTKELDAVVVRYADDFVVLTRGIPQAGRIRENIRRFLAIRGLQYSPEKTRIVKLKQGFDFLGFNVRRYEVTKCKAGQDPEAGVKLLIKPSDKAVKKAKEKIKEVFEQMKGAPQSALIKKLRPITRGWANYYKVGVAKEAFSAMDNYLWKKTWKWAKRRHPNKGGPWRAQRYWGKVQGSNDRWVFQVKDKHDERGYSAHLPKMVWTPIERHVMVKGSNSVYDPELKDYWDKRRIKYHTETGRKAWLHKRQDGKCPLCGHALRDPLMPDEELHIHHIVPRKDGGKDDSDNLMLVHLYCHQQAHTLLKRGTLPTVAELQAVLPQQVAARRRGAKAQAKEEAKKPTFTMGALYDKLVKEYRRIRGKVKGLMFGTGDQADSQTEDEPPFDGGTDVMTLDGCDEDTLVITDKPPNIAGKAGNATQNAGQMPGYSTSTNNNTGRTAANRSGIPLPRQDAYKAGRNTCPGDGLHEPEGQRNTKGKDRGPASNTTATKTVKRNGAFVFSYEDEPQGNSDD